MSTLYTATALAKASGASYRQVEYWTNCGYLRPVPIEGLPAKGSGNRRVYDDDERVVCSSLVALTGDYGALVTAIRDARINGAARVTPLFVLAHDEGLES